MKRKLFTTFLAFSLMLGTAVPSFASTTDVTIAGEATTIDMSVPTSCPIVFEADGTNTTPDNFTITNNSQIAGVIWQRSK